MATDKKALKCSICHEKIDEHVNPSTNKVYWTEGHNAQPINNGRCCTICNDTIVVPVRLTRAFGLDVTRRDFN